MSKRVLIIEDDIEVRSVEKDLLAATGYEVLEAGNSTDGIQLAIKEKPDIILMDIRLPNKKRGIGAAKILRKTEETCDIPIIFVTGYLGGKDTNEVKNIPNCEYITKPFKLCELVEVMKKYIG